MGLLLVVDDDAATRETIRQYLAEAGHTVAEAGSAEQAFELIQESPPDLVLVDVILPGIHGFEAARRIKAMPLVKNLPILMISVLHDHSSRLLGLRMGADDFLAKPIDRFELETRVANLLAQQTERLALAQKNAELVELDRFKEELSTLLMHDLKNPLAVVQSNLEYLSEQLYEGSPAVREALEDTQAATRRVMRLLGNLLDVSRIEANRFDLRRETIRLAEFVNQVLSQRGTLVHSRKLTLVTTIDPDLTVSADPDVLERIIENIFDNALRYTQREGQIEFHAYGSKARTGFVELRIGNTGPPIPQEIRAVVFEKFGRAQGSLRVNLGLGMYFCRIAAEAHGGRIFIEETPALPTIFVIELPTRSSD
jgi:two-component system sensor histidine kinase/response regulator